MQRFGVFPIRQSTRSSDLQKLKYLKFIVWNNQDFSVTQLLREINFENLEALKKPIFAILGALKIVNLVNFSFQKVQKYIKIKF